MIPCYGSELTIKQVIDEIHTVMCPQTDYCYEIIAVNDFSPDNVYSVLKSLTDIDTHLTIIDLSKNMGKCNAVLAGYSFVTGDYVVNIDDDGQCPLDKLWDLVKQLDNGYDVSIAKYTVKKQSAFKNFGSKVNEFMSQILIGKPKGIKFTNFSVVRRYVVEEIIKYNHPFAYLEGLILRVTRNIANVEMEERERFAGEGNFNFQKSLSLWLNGFTAFSVKPLRISTILGFAIAVFGFIFGLTIVIQKLTNPSIVLGYSSLMAVILFLGGSIMVMLGLIGEYIGRIYICINNSPQYVIKEIIHHEKIIKKIVIL